MLSSVYSEIAQFSTLLYQWLGTFWAKAGTFPKAITQGGFLVFSETVRKVDQVATGTDRATFSTTTTTRWTPLVLRQSEANSGKALLLRWGEGNNLFGDPGLFFGGVRRVEDIVSYPVSQTGLSMLLLCNNPVNPTKVLAEGRDFKFRDNTLLLRETDDPFLFPSDYLSRKVEGDTECVVWAKDVQSDTQEVLHNLGYLLGLQNSDPTEACRDFLNAILDCIIHESTQGYLTSLLGSLYGIPTAKAEGEVVQSIRADGLVATETHLYRADPDKLSVHVGSRLAFGQPLDSRLLVFGSPFTVDRYYQATPLSSALPELPLDRSNFSFGLVSGTVLNWNPVEVTQDGQGGVSFPISASIAENAAFWEEFNKRCVAAGLDAYTCFSNYVYAKIGVVPSPLTISPARWFLDTFGSGFASIVVITDAQSRFDLQLALNRLPVKKTLLVVERQSCPDDTLTLQSTERTVLCDATGNSETSSILATSKDRVVHTKFI